MSFRDLALAALTYPDATPDIALRTGVAIARRIGGQLTLISLRVKVPALHNPVANAMLGLDKAAGQATHLSDAAAHHEASSAAIAAEECGVKLVAHAITSDLEDVDDNLARAARTHDLCLLAVGAAAPAARDAAEAVLFGAGRPVMIFPDNIEWTPSERFGTVVVAWDGSARAARAVADAMPLLSAARQVRILAVTGEKPQVEAGVTAPLLRHLAAHGVAAEVDEVAIGGRKIGEVIRHHVVGHGVELVVMGGFGHARFREFVLGGATQSLLEAPPCAVMMSH